jgi:hypothetical protein
MATTGSTGTGERRGRPDRAVSLVVAGLVALRVVVVDHAPAVADAALAFGALVVVTLVRPGWPWARAALAVVLGAAASIAPSADPWLSLLSMSLVIGIAGFFGLGLAPATQRPALAGLVIGGALHVVAAFGQRFVLWPDALARRTELGLSPALVERLASGRPIGLSLSPDLGAGIALATAVAGGALLVAGIRHPLARVAVAVVVFAAIGAITLSRSFGTAVAVAAAVGIVVVATRAWRLVAGLGLAAVALGAAASARGWGALATSAGERLWNWRTGLAAFIDAPWTGHGLLRFASVYAERRPPEANITRYAHSAPVQILAETGVVGAVAVLVAVVAVLGSRRGRTAGSRASTWILGLGAAAFAARTLIDYDLHVGQSAMVGFVVLGAASTSLADDGQDSAQNDRQDDGQDDPEDDGRPRRVAMGLAVIAALLLGLLLWRTQAGADSPLVRVDVDVALRTTAAAPPALTLARVAPFVDRHPAAAVVAARAALGLGDPEKAVLLLETALGRDPGLASAHRLLVALANRGVGDRAAREAAARQWRVDIDADAPR